MKVMPGLLLIVNYRRGLARRPLLLQILLLCVRSFKSSSLEKQIVSNSRVGENHQLELNAYIIVLFCQLHILLPLGILH